MHFIKKKINSYLELLILTTKIPTKIGKQNINVYLR